MKITIRSSGGMLEVQVQVLLLLLGVMACAVSDNNNNNNNNNNNKLHYVNYDCGSNDNSYSAGSPFESALNYSLFSVLPTNATVASYSSFESSDQVYTDFYCRGDVERLICEDCVKAAATSVAEQCRYVKQGIVWYQECTLRYSDHTLVLENESPVARVYNYSTILSSYYLDSYVSQFDKFMITLLNQAAYNDTLHAFSTGQLNLSSLLSFKGLLQCTPHIGAASCDRCLTAALRLRDSWSNTMVLLPTCLVRFLVYGSPLSFQPSSAGSHKRTIVVTVSVLVGLISLLLIGFFLYRVYQWRKEHYHKGCSSRFSRFTYSQVARMTNEFGRQLGIGSFGVVYHGSLTDGRQVAVKMLNIMHPSHEEFAREQFKTEVRVLEAALHSNLVSLVGYCEEGANLGLVYEYMAGGNLRDVLAGPDPLSWTDRVKIAIGAAQGLVYLHGSKPPIIHRDVKTTNILLDEHLQAKIADFGVAKIFPDEYQLEVLTRVMGTPGYLDQEYHVSGQLNEKSDVYSFGVVLLELITGKEAIIRGEEAEAEKRVKLVMWVRGRIENEGWDIKNIIDPRLETEVREENYMESVVKATKLGMRCVGQTAAGRPTMREVLAHLTNLASSLLIQVDPNALDDNMPTHSLHILSLIMAPSLD